MAEGDDLSALDGWNPQLDDYNNADFNCYVSGPGSSLPRSRQVPVPFDTSYGGKRENIQLFVKGIPNELSNKGLADLFARAGTVLDASKKLSKIPNAKDTFGFVTFTSVAEAEEACRLFDGYQLGFGKLSVQIAKSSSEVKTPRQICQSSAAGLMGQDSGFASGEEVQNRGRQLNISPRQNHLNGPVDTRNSLFGMTPRRPNTGIPSKQEAKVYQRTGHGESDGSDGRSAKPTTRPCMLCHQPGVFRCATCKGNYCSKECQTKDWKGHKRICKQMEVWSRAEGELIDQFVFTVPDAPPIGKVSLDQKNGKVMTRDMSFETLADSKVLVQVQLVITATDFWVQKEENMQSAAKLLDDMSKFYMATAEEGNMHIPEKGELVAAQYTDKRWYRAQVEYINGDTVGLLSHDWGNSEEVHRKHIRALDPKFAELCLQAIHCGLQGVQACGTSWSKNEIAAAKELIVPEKKMYWCTQHSKSSDTSWVELIETETHVNVSEELLRMRCAKRSMNCKVESHLKNKEKSVMSSYSSGDEASTKLLVPAVDGPVIPPPSNHIAKHLQKGQAIVIQVLDAISPSLFWVHVVSDPMYNELQQLQSKLNQHYSQMKTATGFRPPGHGLVAAKYSVDNEWYRGQVLDVKPTSIKIRYLDFGNEESVPPGNLHSLESTFCSLPFQSVYCSLSGIIAQGEQWSSEALLTFGKFVGGKRLHARVVNSLLDVGIVHLDIRKEDKSGTVNDAMVEVGMAKYGSYIYKSDQPELKTSDVYKSECPLESDLPELNTSDANKSECPLEPVEPVPHEPSIRMSSTPPPMPKLYDVPDTEVLVRVTDASSHNLFYVQVLDEVGQTKLKEVEAILSESLQNYQEWYKPAIGEHVCARFSQDQIWYRAEVLSVEGSLFRVRFVDYGNEDNLDVRSIAAMPEKLRKYPMLGIPCCFESPGNLKLTGKHAWDPQFLSPFEKLYKMTVSNKLENPVLVKLLCNESGTNVLQNLIQMTILECILPKLYASQLPNQELAEANKVQICFINSSPADFCIHSIDNLFEKRFTKVTQNLTDILGEKPTESDAEYIPDKDELVAAKDVDGCWYRAAVIQNNEKTIHVYFVDFGNFSDVSANCVQPLAAESDIFADIPALAHHCHLVGSDKLLSKFSGTCTEEFKNCFSNRLLDIQVYGKEEVNNLISYSVDLILPDNEHTCTAAASLKDKNLWPVSKYTEIASQVPLKENEQELSSVVVYAESPSSFFVNISSPSYCEIMQLVVENCKQQMKVDDPQAGEYVCAYSKPFESWNRGVIKEISGARYLVHYVDFGNTEFVTVDQMQPFSDSLCTFGPQAYHCAIYGIQGTTNGIWTEEAKQLFSENVVNNHMKLQVLKYCSSGPSFVDFILDGHEDCISERLVDIRIAQRTIPVDTDDCVKNPSAAPFPAVKTNWSPGEKLSVKIPFLTTVETICAHPESTDWHLLLAKMGEEMQKCGSTLGSCRPRSFTPDIGDVCLALYQEDRMWYRSRIVAKTSKTFQVEYIDFGNTSEIPVEAIYQLPTEMTEIPPLVLKLHLDGANRAPKEWFEEALPILHQILQSSQSVDVTIIKVEEQQNLTVQMVVDGQDILTQLQQSISTPMDALQIKHESLAENNLRQENEQLKKQVVTLQKQNEELETKSNIMMGQIEFLRGQLDHLLSLKQKK